MSHQRSRMVQHPSANSFDMRRYYRVLVECDGGDHLHHGAVSTQTEHSE